MIIIRLFFIVSALFLLLAFGLGAALFLKIRLNMKNAFMNQEPKPGTQNYPQDGKTIEGEYKIIDESHKE